MRVTPMGIAGIVKVGAFYIQYRVPIVYIDSEHAASRAIRLGTLGLLQDPMDYTSKGAS